MAEDDIARIVRINLKEEQEIMYELVDRLAEWAIDSRRKHGFLLFLLLFYPALVAGIVKALAEKSWKMVRGPK